MNKTVWYISKYFAPGMEGAIGARNWFILKEFVNRGEDVVVITSDSNHLAQTPKLSGGVKRENRSGIEIIWLNTFKYPIAKSSRRILSWLHFEWKLFWLRKKSIPKPDAIIVSSLSILTIINGLLLKRKYKCKLVFEIRDIWPLTIVEEGGYSPKNLFVKVLGFIERLGYRKSDLTVGTMPNLSQHVTEVLGHEAPVACIPMGISAEMLNTDECVSDEYIEKYLNQDYFNIVYAGTIGITNALETFFDAAEALKDNKSLRFVIVGDGALKETYREQYSHLSNLIFAPRVNKNQVHSVLSNASLVYFSTYKSKVWDYGQSLNKVIDYMLSGKPVLASYSGYPSMINEAGCGFYVPAEDVPALVAKIEELFALPESERELIGKRGRDWLIQNRSYDVLADKYLSLIFSD